MESQEGTSGLDRLVAELQQEIDARERAIYSARVIEEARNPRNLGRMARPDAHALVHGWCGDTMEIYLRLKGQRIQKATCVTDGCGPSLACGGMLTATVEGLTLGDASQVTPEDLVAALDGLPEESVHCAELAVSTLREAMGNRSADRKGQGAKQESGWMC